MKVKRAVDEFLEKIERFVLRGISFKARKEICQGIQGQNCVNFSLFHNKQSMNIRDIHQLEGQKLSQDKPIDQEYDENSPVFMDLGDSFEMNLGPLPPLDTIFTGMDDQLDQLDGFEEKVSDCYQFGNILSEVQKPRIFKCTFCRKQFSKSTALGGHTSKMHPREKQLQREEAARQKGGKKNLSDEAMGVGKRKKIRNISKDDCQLAEGEKTQKSGSSDNKQEIHVQNSTCK